LPARRTPCRVRCRPADGQRAATTATQRRHWPGRRPFDFPEGDSEVFRQVVDKAFVRIGRQPGVDKHRDSDGEQRDPDGVVTPAGSECRLAMAQPRRKTGRPACRIPRTPRTTAAPLSWASGSPVLAPASQPHHKVTPGSE
jgi:hypothetical protein